MTLGAESAEVGVGSTSHPTRSGALLVDFDNLNDRRGTADVAIQVQTYLHRAIQRFVDEANIDELHVRLYGGWRESGVTSRRASEVSAALGAASLLPAPHPTRTGVLRGTVDLATSLISHPTVHWPDTYAAVPGTQRVRLATTPHPAGCASPNGNCMARNVMRFTRGTRSNCPVDGCQVTAESAFIEMRQKMVDTLLACDAVDYAHEVDALGIVTCDLDVVPAVARATSSTADVLLIQPWSRIDEGYVSVLAELGVRVFSLEIGP